MTPTPRHLDPKFKDEQPEEKTDETPETDDSPETHDDETPMIVHNQKIVQPDGSVAEKQHGPMPVADWPAYEKEHKL
jgi:hypothetical protein